MRSVVLMGLPQLACGAFGQGEPPADHEPDKVVEPVDDAFKVIPDPAGKAYFPEGRASYYTRHLSAMKEPSLQAPLEKVQRVFRFTYLPSFADALMVRISEKSGGFEFRAVRLKCDKNERPSEVTSDKTWTLDEKSAKVVREALSLKEDFWTPLSKVERMLGGMDGAMWVFEIRDGDGYRMIDVSNPNYIAMMGKEGIESLLTEFSKGEGGGPVKSRDYVAYQKTGWKVLEIGKLIPLQDAEAERSEE